MKRVIDGRRYDTDTAEFLCDLTPASHNINDFKYENTSLYRTQRGAYFLSGSGHGLTRWARKMPDGGYGYGEGIIPLDDREALRVLENEAEDELIEKYFGDVVQDA